MTPFDFDPSIRVVYGPGTLSGIDQHVSALSGQSVLVVSDPGVVEAGITGCVESALKQAGIPTRLFADVGENPTSRDVEAGAAVAADGDPVDVIVAVGGGSAMDCAKGINFLVTNGGQIEDYHGFGKAKKAMLPSIGIPTTAGTGSEAQSYALISQADTHVKMACGDRKARFHTVILDPDLIASAPKQVKAAAGYDALAHAVESFVCKRANRVSRMFAREAFALLDDALIPYVENRADARPGDVLLGAHLAGMAIEASMLGAAHGCANPLTAEYGITHGVAVALMLPSVVRFNSDSDRQVYEGLSTHNDLVDRLSLMRSSLGLPGRLEEAGVIKADLPKLAEAAAEQWTASFNPTPVDADAARGLYEAAF